MSNVRAGSDEESGAGDTGPLVRIGELARRAGIPAATLRAWERRYAVVEPRRGDSGYRLYSAADERRLLTMVSLIEQGLAPAEAAERIRADEAAVEVAEQDADFGPVAEAARAELIAALGDFDGERADRAIGRAISTLSTEAFLSELALPVLREIGTRWAEGIADISEEHFGSSLMRGRLLGLARGWDGGAGPQIVLACAPGERHDLGVICFGLALRARGWRVSFLGADTPIEAITVCLDRVKPDALVLFAMEREGFESIQPDLKAIASGTRILLAGTGAEPDVCISCGAEALEGDPVEAARVLAR